MRRVSSPCSASLAEAVNILMEKGRAAGRYGHDDKAKSLAIASRPSLRLGHCETRPTPGAVTLCSTPRGPQRGRGVTPGFGSPMARSRIPPATCWRWRPTTALPLQDQRDPDPGSHHPPEPAGAAAALQGRFAIGMREFTANVADSDLVRVTGYMIRKRGGGPLRGRGLAAADHLPRRRASEADRDPPAAPRWWLSDPLE